MITASVKALDNTKKLWKDFAFFSSFLINISRSHPSLTKRIWWHTYESENLPAFILECAITGFPQMKIYWRIQFELGRQTWRTNFTKEGNVPVTKKSDTFYEYGHIWNLSALEEWKFWVTDVTCYRLKQLVERFSLKKKKKKRDTNLSLILTFCMRSWNILDPFMWKTRHYKISDRDLQGPQNPGKKLDFYKTFSVYTDMQEHAYRFGRTTNCCGGMSCTQTFPIKYIFWVAELYKISTTIIVKERYTKPLQKQRKFPVFYSLKETQIFCLGFYRTEKPAKEFGTTQNSRQRVANNETYLCSWKLQAHYKEVKLLLFCEILRKICTKAIRSPFWLWPYQLSRIEIEW